MVETQQTARIVTVQFGKFGHFYTLVKPSPHSAWKTPASPAKVSSLVLLIPPSHPCPPPPFHRQPLILVLSLRITLHFLELQVNAIT